MPGKEAKIKRGPTVKSQQGNEETIVINNKDNECPIKQGDNCLVPGAYNDSAPIGGG